MRSLMIACALAMLAATSAAAQQQPQMQTLPQVRINPQVLVRPQLTPRQLEIWRGAGITTAPTSVQSATIVSVRAPVAAMASLNMFNVASYSPGAESTGVAVLRANPATSDQSWVEVSFSADATSRYIVDCAVGGSATNYRFVRYSGEGSARRREETRVPVSGGRIGMVLQPRGSAGGQAFFVMGLDQGWQFKSCEITPVS